MRILPTEDESISELFVDDNATSELFVEDDAASEAVIRTGKLVVKLDGRTVEVEGHPVRLTRKEYGILELLSLHKGTTLNQEMFLNHLYGGTDEPAIKIIDVFICKLRKKLSAATGGDNYIKTIWRRGYVLCDPPADGAMHAVPAAAVVGAAA